MFKTNQLKSEFEYDTKVSFEDRKKDVERIQEKYPGKIPMIAQKSKNSKLMLGNDFKPKFLINPEQTIGNFMVILRKRLELVPEQSLFLFVAGSVLPNSTTLGEAYNLYKDEDGFLKIIFCEENTFGN
jgi:GABA(A) receptor-associated protein